MSGNTERELREALERIAGLTCSCHDSADENWHGRRCPKGIAIAALSADAPGEQALQTKVQSWANNCAVYEAQHRAEGDREAAEYHRGGKEAFERVRAALAGGEEPR